MLKDRFRGGTFEKKKYKSREMHNKVKELTSKNIKRKQVDA